MKKSFSLIVALFSIFYISGCINSNGIENVKATDNIISEYDESLSKDEIIKLLETEEFLRKYYSGFYYFPEKEHGKSLTDSFNTFQSYTINSTLFPQIDKYRLDEVCDGFTHLSDMKTLIEKYVTISYAEKVLYSNYDNLYYETDDALLFDFGSSTVFNETLDYNTIEVIARYDDKMKLIITYSSSPDNHDYSKEYILKKDGEQWKIDEVVYLN